MMELEHIKDILSFLKAGHGFLADRINPPISPGVVPQRIKQVYGLQGDVNPILSLYSVFNGFAIDRSLNVPGRYWNFIPQFVFFDFEETMEEITADYCGYEFIEKAIFPLFTNGDIGYICFDVRDKFSPVLLYDNTMDDEGIVIFDSSIHFLAGIRCFFTEIASINGQGLIDYDKDLYYGKMKEMNPLSMYWEKYK